MKKLCLAVIVMVFGASIARAQPASIGIGITQDEKSFQLVPGIKTQIAIYHQHESPPLGWVGEGWCGMNSTSWGMSTIVVETMYMKLFVNPYGFKEYVKAQWDVTGTLRLWDKRWDKIPAMNLDPKFGFSQSIRLDEPGILNLNVRLTSKDGRSYVRLVGISLWTSKKKEFLPVPLEIIVKAAPRGFETMNCNEAWQYTRGFEWPYAEKQGQPQGQQITVPGQHSEQSIGGNEPTGNTDNGLPPDLPTPGERPNRVEPPMQSNTDILPPGLPIPETKDKVKAKSESNIGVQISVGPKEGSYHDGWIESAEFRFADAHSVGTTAQLSNGEVVIYLAGDEEFNAKFVHRSGQERELSVYRTNGKYWARTWAPNDVYAGGKVIIEKDGQTRTIALKEAK